MSQVMKLTDETVRLRPGKWRDERKCEYVRSIDMCKVNEIVEKVYVLSVDDVSQQLKHILIDPALKIFPQFSKKYIKTSNNSNMAGYDKQCYKSRKEYHKAKNKHNRQKTTLTYNALIDKSRRYKGELKRVKNKNNTSVLQKLRENKTKDPKAYWKILKSSQAKKKSQIPLDKFYDHFKSLFAESDDANERLEFETHNDTDSPILNDPITPAEIRRCIGKRNNGKSPGNDDIINEYIKCTQELLCPLYVRLFNKILDTGSSHQNG